MRSKASTGNYLREGRREFASSSSNLSACSPGTSRNTLATLESSESTGCGNRCVPYKTSQQQGQGLENILSSLERGSSCPLVLHQSPYAERSPTWVTRAMQPAKNRVATLAGTDEHLSGSNCGTISRRPKRVTKEGLGRTAGTTAARAVAILVRCCSWRTTL